MFKLKDGRYRGDRKINGKRYQKTFNTTSLREAKRLEKEWIDSIIKLDKKIAPSLDWLLDTYTPAQASSLVNPAMPLSRASEWMYDRLWQFAEDSINPPSRMRTLIKMLGDLDVTLINDATLLNLKAELLIRGYEGKIYSNKTFNHLLTTLRTTLDALEKAKVVTFYQKPDFKALYAPLKKVDRVVSYTNEELKAISDYFKGIAEQSGKLIDTEMWEYVVINSNLGLRPAEFYALTCGDINLVTKTISITKALKTHGAKSYVGSTKNNVSRTLPIDGLALELLQGILERHKIAKGLDPKTARTYAIKPCSVYSWFIKGEYNKTRGLAFERTPLTKLTQKYCELQWKKMCIALGYSTRDNAKSYTQYTLRHAVASRLVGLKGFSAHKLMQYMGHQNIQTSLKYVHLNTDDIRDGAGVGITD